MLQNEEKQIQREKEQKYNVSQREKGKKWWRQNARKDWTSLK